MKRICAILAPLGFFLALTPVRPASSAVVNCYDAERDIVQTTLAHQCEGEAISDAEAEQVRERLRRKRAGRMQDEAEPGSGHGGERGGSGFAVDAAGHLLTARHVVEGCKTLTVHTPSGERHPASILHLSEDQDIALLRGPSQLRPVAWRTDRPASGDAVVAVGFPSRGLPVVRPLTAAGTLLEEGLDHLGKPMIAFKSPVRGGNSGGPLFDGEGNLVGMVVAKLDTPALYQAHGVIARDIGFAVPAQALKAFLAGHGIEPPPAAAPGLSPPAVEGYALRVLCTR